MQFATHARLEREIVRVLRGGRRDRRRILRMEIAPPIHVVAQEFHQQFFEECVVLAVRSEEAGIQCMIARS